ncbi:MAG: MFS transporter [Planctomycetota bacterium]
MTPVLRSLPRVAAYTWRLHWPAALLVGASNATIMLAAFAFKRSLGGPEKWVPALIALWQAPWILTPLVSGWLSRVHPQRAWRVIGLAAGIPLILVAFVTVEPVLDGKAGEGIGAFRLFALLLAAHYTVSVFYIPHRGALMRTNYPDAVRGRLYGLREILAILAAIVMARGAQSLLDQDPRWLKLVFPIGGLCLIVAYFLKSRIRWRRQARVVQDQGTDPQHLRLAFANRRFLIYQLAFMLYGFGFLMAWVLNILYIEDELALGYDGFTQAFSVAFPVAQITAMFFWGRLADRVGVVRSTAFAFGCLVLYLIAMPHVTGQWSLNGVAALFGASMSGVMIGWALGPLHFAPEGQGHAYTAVHFACVGIRSVIAPFLGYLVKEYFDSYAVGYYAAAAFMIAGTITMFVLARSESRATPGS